MLKEHIEASGVLQKGFPNCISFNTKCNINLYIFLLTTYSLFNNYYICCSLHAVRSDTIGNLGIR